MALLKAFNNLKSLGFLMKSLMNLILILICFDLSLATAGNLQGGGGGRANKSIKRYLDKRIYGLDGARREIVPNIMLINACLESKSNKIHTIEPIWACAKKETVETFDPNSSKRIDNMVRETRCIKRRKKHLSRSFKSEIKKCKHYVTKIINGQLTNVCDVTHKTETVKFPLTYILDVYQLSIGNGGTSLYPNKDYDQFIKTIKYNVPTCLELGID